MAKLTLNPDPTFTGKVEIHVPGKVPAEIEFTFKYRDKDELNAFSESIKGMEDADLIMNLATGWDLGDAFTRENVAVLVTKYYTAAEATFKKYLDELTGAKQKN